MPAPLAYLLTWTTYGSWLPGDSRGWVEDGKPGIQPGDCERRNSAQALLTAAPVILSAAQRIIVESTIRDHCRIRQWQLHAVNARSNHVHVVVTADLPPETVMNQFKAWCSRRLNENGGAPRRWWTKHGSTKWINEAGYLQRATHYVREGQ
jgi:REP element-mobilizing transposase RayT